MKNTKGFTILELLVVVAIIAILSAIAIPNFVGRIDEAKDSQELAEINAVNKAVAAFYADNGYYPTLQRDVVALGQPQPVDGSPHNIKFSEIVPEYLATLPHFSYWWVDYLGNVYHTDTAIGSLNGNILTLAEGYTYKLNDATVLSGSTYTLQAGDYVAVTDSKGTAVSKINANFKNEMVHPEDPDFVPFEGQTFTYTGSVQTFVAPMTGTYQLKVYGAAGGAAKDYGSVAGGLGGRSEGKIVLTAGTELKIYVGGQGTDFGGQGGWNGGGNGTSSWYASGGGGGTDIRLGGSALSNRIIVAGGGGGSFFYDNRGMAGGAGGGTAGGVGAVQSWYFGSGPSVSGGSQTAGGTGVYVTAVGTLGQGGSGSSVGYTGGGGGGYYGGSGGEQRGGAGAGGSGYVGGVTAGAMFTGVRAGDGLVEITRAVD